MRMFDRSRQAKWDKNNYETIIIRARKGRRDELKTFAAEHGISLSKLITDAIEEKTGINIRTGCKMP